MLKRLKKLVSGILAVSMFVSLVPTALAADLPSVNIEFDGQIALMHTFCDENGSSISSSSQGYTDLMNCISGYTVSNGTIEENAYYPGVEYNETFQIPKPTTATVKTDTEIPTIITENNEVYALKTITYTWYTSEYSNRRYNIQSHAETPITLENTWPTDNLTYYSGVPQGTEKNPTAYYPDIVYKWEKQSGKTPDTCAVSFQLNGQGTDALPNADANTTVTIRYAVSDSENHVTDIKTESVRSLATATGDLKTINVPQGYNFYLYPGTQNYFDNGNQTLFATVTRKSTAAQVSADTAPVTDETSYYAFLGWTTGEEENPKIYSYGDKIQANDSESMTLYGVWEEIDLDAVEETLEKEGAPEIILATNNNSATVQQSLSENGTEWTSSFLQLEEEADDVYYRATMKMDEKVAALLANRTINNSEFAHFDIAVDLDENLKLKTTGSGESETVSFTFTCAFLKPENKIVVTKPYDSSEGGTKTENVTTVNVTSTSSENTTAHTITLNVSDITDDDGHVYPFTIPVNWYVKDSSNTSYTANQLLSEIKLEVVAAVADKTVNKVISGGNITGQINFDKVLDEAQFDHLVGYLAQDDLLKNYYYASGAEGVARVLLLSQAVKNASQDINLGANQVCAYREPDATFELVDIIIYRGGEEGYDGVVDDNGNIVSKDNNEDAEANVSFPTPGFRVKLSDELQNYLDTNNKKITDISFAVDDPVNGRKWTLEPYGADNGVDSYDVFRFVPAAGQEPIRVIVTDEDGNTQISDSFESGDEVHQEYTMSIYTGTVDVGSVVMKIDDVVADGFPFTIKSGALSIRDVTDKQDAAVTEIQQEAPTKLVEKATAVASSSVTYSMKVQVDGETVTIPLNDQAEPSLLFDHILQYNAEDLAGNNWAEVMKAEVNKKLESTSSTRQYELRYLDLVDAKNANAWIVPSEAVDVYWPYPAGTNQSTKFTLLHFEGVDRDMDATELSSKLESCTKTIVDIEKTAYGIKFSTKDFSPFALVWDTSSGSSSGGSHTKPTLNTEDHYGYIIGYPDGPVRPEGTITRAEVATIFFRMLTDESRAEFWSQSNSYSDVASTAWYNNAVSTLSKAGIIAGYEDGTFRPEGSITRAEFATIAVRFFEATYNGQDLFPDIDGHWAQDYINQAANNGLVTGYPDGTFGPDRLITRAEAFTLVNRTLDRHPDQNYFLEGMLTWPDNMDTTQWYYADVQEATNSHEYEMKTDAKGNQYEVWTKILPMRDWAAFEKTWSDANSADNPGDVV